MSGILQRPGYLHLPLEFARAESQIKRAIISRGLAYDLYETQKTNRKYHAKPPIIFLHGLFGSRRNNQSVCKLLSRDLNTQVYALDLRNHGDSFHHPDHDYNVMADDVSTFMKDNGLKEATVIGHSMGAKVAMTLALRAPDLVASLISVDNAPVRKHNQDDFGQYIRGMAQVEAASLTSRSQADKVLEQFVPSPAVRQFLLGNLQRPQGSPKLKFRIPLNILHGSLGVLGDFPDFASTQQRFSKPALFIRGNKSDYASMLATGLYRNSQRTSVKKS
ncbi:alpha beta fold family [Ophiocordyceps camponoti-floridani]|uniref:Alpha beta fold family n=1 Tax=Ophiocordyceps camponoti-floridani TaxID=2030778 RepID=A0A8H4Q2H3_9HYPO|nr:alpha beta fold family [Ophiocordyceps camponoti-floridani]